MTNRQVAELLRAVSAAYEIIGESHFKVTAYDRAATGIELSTSEAKDLWDDNNLMAIPGVGKGIADHLDELFRTGKVKHFEKAMKNLPPAMFSLLGISRIGPKTAYKLVTSLKIKNPKTAIEELKSAAQEGRIRSLPGFGEEKEKDILESINHYDPGAKRMLLPFATELANQVIEYMKKEKAVLRVDSLGSLRRKVATIGDIDLAVVTNEPQKVLGWFSQYPKAKSAESVGMNTARITLENGRSVDIKTQTPAAYGALLQHYTGSKEHNIHLREIALKKDLSLSEYGITPLVKSRVKKKIVEFNNENDFYQYLGMKWIPPELRENAGEIEASIVGNLPRLVKDTDIKGDFHLHSDFDIEPSHDVGGTPMEVMIKKALELGYEYMGFSEHNPRLSNHTDNRIFDLLKRKKDVIDKYNYSSNKMTQGLFIFNGLEVDIRPKGDLACPDRAFELLDYMIVSVHSSFDMSQKEMTDRIIQGLSHPKALILGHPTGRILGRREGYEVDWERLFEFCLKERKILEIDAWPDRADLPDVLVREAVKRGVKMMINTDSHHVDQMRMMPNGVSVARRGWAERKDIINTLPLNQFRDKISRY